MTQATSFPNADGVSLTVSSAEPVTMNLRIRVPSWATGPMDIRVNGERAVTGTPGRYASVLRKWANHDMISFVLPTDFRVVKYTGLDQAPGNVDRCGLLRGPILMALDDANGRIRADAATLPSLLTVVAGSPLQYVVKGTAYRFLPYWQVGGRFTCFPMVQP